MCCKELAHMIMEVDKSKICSVVLQAPDTGESMVQMKPEVILLKNFLLLEKDWSFVLFRPSTDWLRSMHIVEVNLLCSTVTTLNISVKVLVAQSCPTLCNPMDCSPPGSSVCGILQARIQEWVAIPFSRESS